MKILQTIDDSIYSQCFASTVRNIGVRYELVFKAPEYFFKCAMIFFIQITIVVLVGLAALLDKDGLKFEKPQYNMMILRILCCYLFHA